MPLTPRVNPRKSPAFLRAPLIGNMSHVTKCLPRPCWFQNPVPVTDFLMVICSAHVALLVAAMNGRTAAAPVHRRRTQQPGSTAGETHGSCCWVCSARQGPGDSLRSVSL